MYEINYKVCAPEGASGHFLGHFLHPSFKSDTAGLRVDNLDGNNPIFEYTGSDDDGHTHDMDFQDQSKIVLRIITPSHLEKFKAVFNVHFKFNDGKFIRAPMESFDYVFNKHYDHLRSIEDPQYQHVTTPNAINIPYDDIFNLYKLTELYYNIHKDLCPDYKIKYAQSYINRHIKLYNRWELKVMEQVFNFEYNNNLLEGSIGKTRMRTWTIDQITETNWQTFLEENLCLTNYC